LPLTHEARSGEPIVPEVCYRYIVERGPVPDEGESEAGLPIAGKTCSTSAADDYVDAVTVQQSKQLMRMLLNHLLGGKILHTRELIKDLQKL